MFLTIAILFAVIGLILWIVAAMSHNPGVYTAAKACLAVALVALVVWLVLLLVVTDADAFSYG